MFGVGNSGLSVFVDAQKATPRRRACIEPAAGCDAFSGDLASARRVFLQPIVAPRASLLVKSRSSK
jgi:hypothetical protein